MAPWPAVVHEVVASGCLLHLVKKLSSLLVLLPPASLWSVTVPIRTPSSTGVYFTHIYFIVSPALTRGTVYIKYRWKALLACFPFLNCRQTSGVTFYFILFFYCFMFTLCLLFHTFYFTFARVFTFITSFCFLKGFARTRYASTLFYCLINVDGIDASLNRFILILPSVLRR